MPAFLFSHQNRLRRADFADSFPPGEAKGGCAAKFFDPAQQSVFPQRDFEISTMADICPFVLRVTKDPETDLCAMERIDIPEAAKLK